MHLKYLWYSNKGNVASTDNIHQTLAYGELDDINELINDISLEKMKQIFLNKPKKVYTKPGLNFISKYILNISQPFNENEYLKSALRNIR